MIGVENLKKSLFLSRAYPSPALVSKCLPRNYPYFTGFNTTGADMELNKDIVEVTSQSDFNNCEKTPGTPDQTTTSNNSNSNTSKTQVVGIVARPKNPSTIKYYISTDKQKCNAGLKVKIVWFVV